MRNIIKLSLSSWSPIWLAVVVIGASCGGSCGSPDAEVDAGENEDRSSVELDGAPLLYAPTANSIIVNAVYVGDAGGLKLDIRKKDTTDWSSVAGNPRGGDLMEWRIDQLSEGTTYEYRVVDVTDPQSEKELFRGEFRTKPLSGSPFVFDVIADSHVYARDFTASELEQYPLPESHAEMYARQKASAISLLPIIASNMAGDGPDFIVHLGDIIDFHGFEFENPPPDGTWTRKAYLEYRQLLGDLLGNTAHFAVIGNWEGENGYLTDEEISYSREQRLLYLPGPSSTTYPQGGSGASDYYAFTWGDALIVVLNVMTYTPTAHLLGESPGLPDDWTLGDDQLLWLQDVLKSSSSRWKFVCIHHTVGGNGGDYENSVYGRGGGRAAHVGEQAVVHDLMLQYGVQLFFYGHDHVFTDMVVDGIHYTLPGSAGAPWRFVSADTGYKNYWPDSGHARVNVKQDKVVVDFVTFSGEVLHSFDVN